MEVLEGGERGGGWAVCHHCPCSYNRELVVAACVGKKKQKNDCGVVQRTVGTAWMYKREEACRARDAAGGGGGGGRGSA